MNPFEPDHPPKPFKTVEGNFNFFIAMPSHLGIDVYQKQLHEKLESIVEELCKSNNFGVTWIQTYMDVKND